jgi:hypothetical protein
MTSRQAEGTDEHQQPCIYVYIIYVHLAGTAGVTMHQSKGYQFSVSPLDRDCQHEAQQPGERPCSALGYCLTPGEPKAANDARLNEPDAVRFYAVGASQMLAQHWDPLFKVLGPCI